ncbi:MAG: hypothetical protein ACI8ZN_002609 [Bacteroidia bacterium]|jgi:hypothetical protein
MAEKYLSELHKTNGEWVKKLEFYRDEVKTFNNRLEELVVQNTKVEVTAQIERFQNQFIRENEVIDILVHDIHEEEVKIAAMAQANNVATDHRKAEENAGLVDRMQMFDKIFAELKAEFTRFAAKSY